jgi:hypothetical protein
VGRRPSTMAAAHRSTTDQQSCASCRQFGSAGLLLFMDPGPG